MSLIRIPTPDELESRLGGLDRLLKAKRWERAAIVWAFTTSAPGRRTDLPGKAGRFPVPMTEFAAMGYAGLTREESVARYREAWQAAIDAGHVCSVDPGDEIEMPDLV